MREPIKPAVSAPRGDKLDLGRRAADASSAKVGAAKRDSSGDHDASRVSPPRDRTVVRKGSRSSDASFRKFSTEGRDDRRKKRRGKGGRERERERERACVGKGTRIGGRGGLGGRGRAGTRTVVERAGGEA